MTQSRRHSALEAVSNIAIGFVLSLLLQMFLMHAMAVPTSWSQDVQITICFTILSLVRTYVLRRIWNRVAR